MPEIKIKIDDNKDLISSLGKRTKLLEKLLAKKNDSFKAGEITKMINEAHGKDMKMFKQTVSSLTSALSKVKQPEIKIEQKDNSSEFVKSLNKRISLLENLIKQMKRVPQTVVQKIVQPESSKLRTIEKNTNIIIESLSKQRRGTNIIPSPS